MTREEWELKWEALYKVISRQVNSPTKAMLLTHEEMRKKYGPRPAEARKPPLWLHLVASITGVSWDMITKVWDWLNGKKTLFGIILTSLSWLLLNLPQILQIVGVDAAQIAFIVGILTTIVGVGHRIYKFIYKEEHP